MNSPNFKSFGCFWWKFVNCYFFKNMFEFLERTTASARKMKFGQVLPCNSIWNLILALFSIFIFLTLLANLVKILAKFFYMKYTFLFLTSKYRSKVNFWFSVEELSICCMWNEDIWIVFYEICCSWNRLFSF